MLVKTHLDKRKVDFKLPNTAYALKANYILVVGIKLKKEGLHGDININKVTFKEKPIFDVDKHIGMPVVEYNLIKYVAAYANHVGLRTTNTVLKATL